MRKIRVDALYAARQPVGVTDVRFARSGDVHVAYRVVGDGPIDLVYVQGAYTYLEIDWELPAYRRYCERLAEFTRLVVFDKRGMGMPDRVPETVTLEERMDDVRAVMDAVGSDRAAIMGPEGGPLACCSPRLTPSEQSASPPGLRGPPAQGRRLALGASSPSTNSRSTSRPFRRAGGPAGRFHASRRASGTSNGVVPGSGGSRSMPPRREHGQASPGWLSGSISATSRRRSTFRRSSFTRPTIRSAT